MNWLLLKNSLVVSSLATLLALGFGLVAALWLAGLPRAWRSGFLALAIIALALPPFLVTNCWLHLLGPAGVWRSWLPFSIISVGGAVWILALLLWPISLLAILTAWQRLDPCQLESDMAMTGWALLRGLLLPVARTALALAAVLIFVLALNNFAVPAILQVKVFPAEMWVRFNTTFDSLGALRLSWPLVLGPLVLLLVFARREIPWPHLQAPVSPKLFRQQLGGAWFWSCGACTALVCLLSVGLPLLQILSVKRTWTELPGALAARQSAAWNSLWLAAGSATLSMVIALVAHSRFARPRRVAFSPLKLLAAVRWLPFLVPGVLLGIGLIALFNRPWLGWIYQGAGIVILAFVVRYSAFGWDAVAHAVRAADPELTDVARLEGANRWQMLRNVFWPQIGPQVIAAWYVVFLLCLWDVESMILVVPPGGETLALRIFNLLHYGHNAQVNALCLALLILALAPLLVWRTYSACKARLAPRCFRGARFAQQARRVMLGAPLFLLPLFLDSCAPSSTSGEATLHSELFRRVRIMGSRGTGVGQLNKPRSVALDNKNNSYVVDMTGRVQKFSPDGQFLLSWQMPQTDLGKPKGMCRDGDGNIIVVEPHYQRVNHFSPDGKLLAQWGERGTNAGQFSLPRAVAVNSRKEIFVSEYGLVERVQKFAFDSLTNALPSRNEAVGIGGSPPRFRMSFGHPGTGPGEFNRPEGLCFDSQDRLYVADSCNHRIQVFSSDGRFLRAYGKAGRGKGELSYPYDICVDAAGRQYVCEFGNSRIQVFDANDRPIESIGGPGAGPGMFSNPWSVALDAAGDLFVADSQNHRLQELIR